MSSFDSSEAWNVAMDLQDDPAGEGQLLSALQMALETANQELEAEARMALGIYWLHKEKDGEAKSELEKAMQLGPASEEDRLCGELYLKAIEMGYKGSSFAEGAQVARSIRKYVTDRLPVGLINNLGVTIDLAGGVRMQVEVDRDLSPEEVDLVNTTIDEALRIHDASLAS